MVSLLHLGIALLCVFSNNLLSSAAPVGEQQDPKFAALLKDSPWDPTYSPDSDEKSSVSSLAVNREAAGKCIDSRGSDSDACKAHDNQKACDAAQDNLVAAIKPRKIDIAGRLKLTSLAATSEKSSEGCMLLYKLNAGADKAQFAVNSGCKDLQGAKKQTPFTISVVAAQDSNDSVASPKMLYSPSTFTVTDVDYPHPKHGILLSTEEGSDVQGHDEMRKVCMKGLCMIQREASMCKWSSNEQQETVSAVAAETGIKSTKDSKGTSLAAEKTQEKTPEKTQEKTPEKTPEKTQEKTPDTAQEKTPEKTTEKAATPAAAKVETVAGKQVKTLCQAAAPEDFAVGATVLKLPFVKMPKAGNVIVVGEEVLEVCCVGTDCVCEATTTTEPEKTEKNTAQEKEPQGKTAQEKEAQGKTAQGKTAEKKPEGPSGNVIVALAATQGKTEQKKPAQDKETQEKEAQEKEQEKEAQEKEAQEKEKEKAADPVTLRLKTPLTKPIAAGDKVKLAELVPAAADAAPKTLTVAGKKVAENTLVEVCCVYAGGEAPCKCEPKTATAAEAKPQAAKEAATKPEEATKKTEEATKKTEATAKKTEATEPKKEEGASGNNNLALHSKTDGDFKNEEQQQQQQQSDPNNDQGKHTAAFLEVQSGTGSPVKIKLTKPLAAAIPAGTKVTSVKAAPTNPWLATWKAYYP